MYSATIQVSLCNTMFHSLLILSHKIIGKRVFDVSIEGALILDIDILQRTNGATNTAITIDFPVAVSDGFLTIAFTESIPRLDNAKANGIEVQLIGPHFAHAVTGGPYSFVDTDGDGDALVPVDGSESHTHAPGETLNSFIWKIGTLIIGTGEGTTLSLPVGQHAVTLTVTDTSNDRNTATTTISVQPQSYPALASISPTSGSIAGGKRVTITGSSLELATAVRFGTTLLTGAAISVFNSTTITVVSPFSGVEVPAAVSVITPIAESNTITFNYIAAIPIQFTPIKLLDIEEPTAVAFGPDSKLYVGTLKGQLAKFTLNENFDTVVESVVTTVDATRGILGIAFDPLDSADTIYPAVYISTSHIFHGEGRNSVGDAVNGKIQTVQGANLDQIADVVTGLPVSAEEHSVREVSFSLHCESVPAI
jgi:Malectin domain/IPT/TIG domain